MDRLRLALLIDVFAVQQDAGGDDVNQNPARCDTRIWNGLNGKRLIEGFRTTVFTSGGDRRG